MSRLSLALVVFVALTGCRETPQQISPAKSATPGTSSTRFTGTVGQLGEASDFLSFVNAHENDTVTLDVRFPSEDFQGGEDSASAFLTLWEDCENLPEGAKPSATRGSCTGFEFHVKNSGEEKALLQEEEGWRLRGRFRVEPAGGPLQGVMIINLTPVQGQPAESPRSKT